MGDGRIAGSVDRIINMLDEINLKLEFYLEKYENKKMLIVEKAQTSKSGAPEPFSTEVNNEDKADDEGENPDFMDEIQEQGMIGGEQEENSTFKNGGRDLWSRPGLNVMFWHRDYGFDKKLMDLAIVG